VSGCRDDFWLWVALAVAVACDDGGSSCCCENDTHRSGKDEGYRPSRTPAISGSSAQNPGKPVVKFAVAGTIVALIAFLAFRSPATHAGAPVSPAPSHVAPTVVETRIEEPVVEGPVEPVAPAVDAEPLTQPAPLVDASSPDAAPLVSADVVPSGALLTNAFASSQPSVAIEALGFDLGSTREEVIAAQGTPPTYAARHQRILWWGSSRVEFDDGGRVRAWMNGTPPLNVVH